MWWFDDIWEKQRERWGTAVISIDCILTEYRRTYNTLKVHEILIIIIVVYWDSLRPREWAKKWKYYVIGIFIGYSAVQTNDCI